VSSCEREAAPGADHLARLARLLPVTRCSAPGSPQVKADHQSPGRMYAHAAGGPRLKAGAFSLDASSGPKLNGRRQPSIFNRWHEPDESRGSSCAQPFEPVTLVTQDPQRKSVPEIDTPGHVQFRSSIGAGYQTSIGGIDPTSRYDFALIPLFSSLRWFLP
jgi:hypothetical protein